MRLEPRGGPLEPLPEGFAVDWRIAWRKGDPALEADAKAFWADLAILPSSADPDERARELSVCAYVDGELAAVATAGLRDLVFLRARFAMHRCVVAPKFRRYNLSRWITVAAIDVIEDWSAENPEARVMGLASIIQANVFEHHRPIWGSGLALAGYNVGGEQIRIIWFKHAHVS